MTQSSLGFPVSADGAVALVRGSLLEGGPEAVEGEVGPARVLARRGVELGPDVRCVCLIGAFDGLHRGHRALLASALAEARSLGVPCVAVTFSPDPAEVLAGPQASSTLLPTADRARGLVALGADAVVSFPFTRELAGTGQRAFVERVMRSVVRPVSVHVGTNFRFGRGGEGDVTSLGGFGRELGFEVHAESLLELDGGTVSATRVRHLLHAGELDEATRLLGRCHYVTGGIRHGRGEGTGFGFPTANVKCDVRTCMPREGVYACYFVLDGSAWPAAVNVGAPPTFSAPERAFLEANLIGFSGDIYGEEAKVVFVRWLRASRRFSSTEELERVVLGNIGWVRHNLGSGRLEVALDK